MRRKKKKQESGNYFFSFPEINLKQNIYAENRIKNDKWFSRSDINMRKNRGRRGLKQSILSYQTLIVFAIPASLAILATCFNLMRYFSLLGKFDYWGISRENIFIFDKAWSGFSLFAVSITIIILTSLFFINTKNRVSIKVICI